MHEIYTSNQMAKILLSNGSVAMATSFLQSLFRQMFRNSRSSISDWVSSILKVTKSLNACIMFAALLNVNRSSIAVVVCRFARAKPTIEWNRGPRRRKKTTDVYLGKRLPCFYHFDWIFKLAIKCPSMCEKMVFLLKVQFVWSWMPVKYVELLIEYTQAWIYEMHAHY